MMGNIKQDEVKNESEDKKDSTLNLGSKIFLIKR